MIFSQQQEQALKKIADWIKSDRQIFRLDGYAGTGKTTIAKYIAEMVTGTVVFAAYTGKAASRLRALGAPNATTIHKLLYKPGAKDQQRLIDLTFAYDKIDRESQDIKVVESRCFLESEIAKEKRRLKQPSWMLDPGYLIQHADLVIIDEWSMVDERVFKDLCNVADKLLFLGDPFQLPPIRGRSPIEDLPVDFQLDEIHRQAAQNPLLVAATNVRNGNDLEFGEIENEFGKINVIKRANAEWSVFKDADVILVGRNKTRNDLNRRWRERNNFTGILMPGETIIILQNDHERMVYNGETAKILNVSFDGDEALVDLQFPDREVKDLDVWIGLLLGKSLEQRPNRMQAIDYAYVITGHKYQGSETANVIVYNEPFATDRARWLYTCITRATKSCTVVQL